MTETKQPRRPIPELVRRYAEAKIREPLRKWADRVCEELVALATVHCRHVAEFRARDVPAELLAPYATPLVVGYFGMQGVKTDHGLKVYESARSYGLSETLPIGGAGRIADRTWAACKLRARQLYEANKETLDPWLDKIYDNLMQAHLVDQKIGSATNVDMPPLKDPATNKPINDAQTWSEMIQICMGLAGNAQRILAQGSQDIWEEAPARKLWVRFHGVHREKLDKFYQSLLDDFLLRGVASGESLGTSDAETRIGVDLYVKHAAINVQHQRFPFAERTYGRAVVDAELVHFHALDIERVSSSVVKMTMTARHCGVLFDGQFPLAKEEAKTSVAASS